MFFRVLQNGYYKGPNTDHFDGRCFFNAGISKRSFKDLLKWRMRHKTTAWPIHREITPQIVKNERVKEGVASVTFINHSTALIQVDGFNILTDPIWSERCSPFKRMGPKRVHQPGVKFHDLPKVDVVILSHNHYDHCDLPTLRKLASRDNPLFITGLGNAAILKKIKIHNVVELDWWQSFKFHGLDFIYTPAQHFSSRALWDRDWALWGGFCLRTSDKLIYFAGDTGYTPHFKEIREKIGRPDIAMLPIGAYEPRWFMRPVHMDPKEALQAHVDLGAAKSMGIHFGTFQLTEEGVDDPPNKIRQLQSNFGLKDEDFWLPKPGESKEFL